MNDRLDNEIARVTAELNQLKQQKMDELRRQMRDLGGEAGSSPASPGREYRKFTDTEVRDLLVKAVEEAGDDGISAVKAAQNTGIPYPRVRIFMPGFFKKTGTGRHTLYFPKKKRSR